MRLVLAIVIAVVLVAFGFDYYRVRSEALCAHATVINMGGHE